MVTPALSAAIRSRLRELAVIDLMVLRTENGAGDLSGQMRLAGARRRGRQPFERQAEPVLKLEPMRNLGLIVGGEGKHQGAFVAQLDVDAAGALQFGGEAGPARLALAAKRDQRLFAGLRLAAGGQHPGSSVTRARSRLGAIEHGDRGAAGEPPGDAEADDARADDGDARLSRSVGRVVRQRRLPSLE